MAFKQWSACTLTLCLGLANASAVATLARPVVNPQTPPQVQFVTAEELKGKLAKNEPVTVIDVRSSSDFGDSGNKIKGAIHVKVRKLQASAQTTRQVFVLPRSSRMQASNACAH